MYILYDFIFLVFAVIYLPYLIFTRRYHSRLVERLGVFDKSFYEALKNEEVVWLHAVSVGEVMAASPLIKEFHAHFPNYKLLISTVTRTGNSIASRIKGEGDLLIYFPLDLSFVISRLLKRIRVRLFLIMETEIWPNIITAFYKRRIPVILMNGRLSERSFRAYSRVTVLLKGVLSKVNLFCMQTPVYAERLEELGVEGQRIKVTGNMKYDVAGLDSAATADSLRASLGITGNNKVLIAGSTHRGEDEIILEAYSRLLMRFPELILLIAPRHVERAGEVERITCEYNFKCRRYSSAAPDAKVIVLDVMGKLRDLFAASDIVFMGGSLLPSYGGHNLLEPAAFKKPILFGPYMSNFKDMAEEFLRAGAAEEVSSSKEIEHACVEFLNSPSKAEEMGQKAFDIIDKNRGATRRNLQYVKGILTSGVMKE